MVGVLFARPSGFSYKMQSHSQAPILTGDLTQMSAGEASCEQSRRVLECLGDNFLVQVVDRPTREVLLALVLTSADELIKEVNMGGSLGCSEHAVVELINVLILL